MKINPGVRLVFIMSVFLIQFVVLITFINNNISQYQEKISQEQDINKYRKNQETLQNNVSKTLNIQIINERETSNLEIIDTQNILKPKDIQITTAKPIIEQPINAENKPLLAR